MSSVTLKLLDSSELKDSCTEFASYFSSDGSSDVLNDLIYGLSFINFFAGLSVIHLTFPNRPMFAMEIFEFVRELNCYLDISIDY